MIRRKISPTWECSETCGAEVVRYPPTTSLSWYPVPVLTQHGVFTSWGQNSQTSFCAYIRGWYMYIHRQYTLLLTRFVLVRPVCVFFYSWGGMHAFIAHTCSTPLSGLSSCKRSSCSAIAACWTPRSYSASSSACFTVRQENNKNRRKEYTQVKSVGAETGNETGPRSISPHARFFWEPVRAKGGGGGGGRVRGRGSNGLRKSFLLLLYSSVGLPVIPQGYRYN